MYHLMKSSSCCRCESVEGPGEEAVDFKPGVERAIAMGRALFRGNKSWDNYIYQMLLSKTSSHLFAYFPCQAQSVTHSSLSCFWKMMFVFLPHIRTHYLFIYHLMWMLSSLAHQTWVSTCIKRGNPNSISCPQSWNVITVPSNRPILS